MWWVLPCISYVLFEPQREVGGEFQRIMEFWNFTIKYGLGLTAVFMLDLCEVKSMIHYQISIRPLQEYCGL